MRMFKITLSIFTAVIALLGLLSSPASALLTVKANHDHIKVDYNYHGSTVSVKGASDPDTDIVITLSSPLSEQHLMKKAKVGGFLWMNVEKLSFENIPAVYLLKSTGKPGEMLQKDQLLQYSIGYDAVRDNATMEASKSEIKDTVPWFEQFFKYKEANQQYAASDRSIEVKDEKGLQAYSTVFQWPYQAPPGKYDVNVFAVRDGEVVEYAQGEVLVEQTGVVKMLANMARNNAAMYGIISIILALAAGFGVGIVFGKDGGAH